eukprot:4810051-Pyramimonas_sp.AAC.1
MRLLYLLIKLYRQPRILDMGTFVSEPIVSEQSVLPGCVVATMMLQLVLLQPLDEVRKVVRAVSLSTVVDDIGLQRFGEEGRVHADLTAAGCELA